MPFKELNVCLLSIDSFKFASVHYYGFNHSGSHTVYMNKIYENQF